MISVRGSNIAEAAMLLVPLQMLDKTVHPMSSLETLSTGSAIAPTMLVLPLIRMRIRSFIPKG